MSNSTTAGFVLITGNTFPVKEQLKALGGRWDAVNKGWLVPAANADQARRLVTPAKSVSGYSPVPQRKVRAGWRPCGYPGCSPSYCDECDGKGGGAYGHY